MKIKIYLSIIFVSVFLIGIGVAFAYFSTNINVDVSADVSVSLSDQADIYFSNGFDLEIDANMSNFGNDDDLYLFSNTVSSATLTATGNYTATYYVYLTILENDFVYTSDNAELILAVKNPDGDFITEINGLKYIESELVSGFDITESRGVFEISIEDISVLDGSFKEEWYFELYFINLDTNQNENAGKSLEANILLQASEYGDDVSSIYEKGSLAETVLLNNSEYYGTNINIGASILSLDSKNTPSFDTISTTDEGMFASLDDFGTSYYFRGDVDDNWVYWAGFYWRIVRIDGQGNIKLIYSGTSTDATGDDAEISVSEVFNSSSDSPEYVGYMYTLGKLHGTSVDSSVKVEIDEWYSANLEDFESDIATDGIFCIDRTAYSDSSSMTEINESDFTSAEHYISYGARKRMSLLKSPELECANELDQLTWDKSSAGNNVLKNPIGLITLDEVAFAGGENNVSNFNYYLYTGSYFWTISPYNYYSESNSYVGRVDLNGDLGNASVDFTEYGIRVSLYLDSKLVATGDGTAINPYVIN